MHHNIIPDQTNPFIELGRFIHENSYKGKGEHSVELPGIKMDIVWKEGDITVVGEIKKSSKSVKGAKIQLLYYLYNLQLLGFTVKGYILIPKERKRIQVNLGVEEKGEIEQLLKEVKETVNEPIPPYVQRKGICSKCGYNQLCWA